MDTEDLILVSECDGLGDRLMCERARCMLRREQLLQTAFVSEDNACAHENQCTVAHLYQESLTIGLMSFRLTDSPVENKVCARAALTSFA